jgi:hypothetical protein
MTTGTVSASHPADRENGVNMTIIECPKCGAHLELTVTLAGRSYDAEEMRSPADLEDEVKLATGSLFLLLGELGLSGRLQNALQRGINVHTVRQRGLLWYLWDMDSKSNSGL